jgi:enamine deaminase RidA (YjgF/YER057c/UK114 family)
MEIEKKLEALGLVLPAALQVAPDVRLPFKPVRVRGNRALVSGNGPLAPDGSVTGPFGKVGADVTLEQANQAAKLTALAVLASLKRELGDLDRVTAWLRVFGMVNAAPGFNRTPEVIDGCSDLLVEIFGDAGRHSRSAVGLAELPFDISVEIELTAALTP